MAQGLSLDEVRHVAKLARLNLSQEQLQQYRGELSSILAHIAKLAELDVKDVQPMAQPHDLTNRLDEDEVTEPMPVDQLLALAPAIEEQFLAVPKVLGGEEQSK